MRDFTLGDAQHQFIQAIQLTGLEPPDFIEPGRLHRFPGQGKRLSNRAAWCLLFDDGRAGCFGDWSRGFSQTWHADQKNSLTPSQSRTISRQAEQARIHRQQEVANQQKTAAKRAAELWHSLKPAPAGHDYLVKKMIEANGARVTRKGWLALPIIDFSESLHSLQFISPNGAKPLLSNGRKKGCFIVVSGELDSNTPLLISEGFGTGVTVAASHLGSCVIASIDCGNLRAVAVGARVKFVDRKIIIFGDDDRLSINNIGRVKATEAAKVAHCELKFPDFSPDAPDHLTDFNDLFVWKSRGSANE